MTRYLYQSPIPHLRQAVFIWWLLLCMAACGSMPETKPDEPISDRKKGVAVWNLMDGSPAGFKRDGWGELFSTGIIEVLEDSNRFEPVERERLLLALEELSLGTSDLVDEETRLRLGRMVGARLMVFGSYLLLDQTMRVDLRLVEVETGRTMGAEGRTFSYSGLPDALQRVKLLARHLISIHGKR